MAVPLSFPLVLLSSTLSSISWLTCLNSFSHAILASLYVVFSLMK
nr:MAG TPA: hypothetical protein [Caudoviricetes sp.]